MTVRELLSATVLPTADVERLVAELEPMERKLAAVYMAAVQGGQTDTIRMRAVHAALAEVPADRRADRAGLGETSDQWPPPEAVERAAAEVHDLIVGEVNEFVEFSESVEIARAALLAAFPVDPRIEAWDQGREAEFRAGGRRTEPTNPYGAERAGP